MSSRSAFAAALLAAAARQAGAGPGVQPCQRRVVEDMGRGVAHFLHRQTDSTGLLVETLVASAIGGLADARDEGQRAFEKTNDFTDRDVPRLPCEDIATAATEFALQKAMTREFQQDRFEELLRQALTLRELRRLNRTLAGFLRRQFEHRLEPVLRLLREHGISLLNR